MRVPIPACFAATKLMRVISFRDSDWILVLVQLMFTDAVILLLGRFFFAGGSHVVALILKDDVVVRGLKNLT